MRNLLCLILLLSQYLLMAQGNPIFIPPILNGPIYNLEMQHGSHSYQSGVSTPSMGFNGNILGPTMILQAGEQVTINVLNSLGEETTVHWHGLHVSPFNDGGPHSEIDPNDTYTASFEVLDKASTYWYHPHLHYFTLKQVSLGLSGFIIVQDLEEELLNLPRNYGIDDFPLLLQTKAYDDVANEIIYRLGNGSGTQHGVTTEANNDHLMMVNATVDGTLEVPRQHVRLRLLNGAPHRVFEVGMSDNSPFFQIGSDGGLLSVPYQTNRVRLAPGERVEIVVDFSAYSIGQNLGLVSYASELPDGIWGASKAFVNSSPTSYDPNPLNGNDFQMLEFNIAAQTSSPVTSLPATLAQVSPIHESEVDVTRQKFLIAGGGGGVTIGNTATTGIAYDIDVVNDNIRLGDTEIWEITSHSPIADKQQYHPFHMHDVQFFILDRTDIQGNISLPHPGERGRKDVVLINPGEKVRVIAVFEDFASTIPYVNHCHILSHEDNGMMAQFTVEEATLYVDRDYNGVEDGSFFSPYNTFTEAVNAASSGSRIVFKSEGIHDEFPPSLTIGKHIVVQQFGGNEIILR